MCSGFKQSVSGYDGHNQSKFSTLETFSTKLIRSLCLLSESNRNDYSTVQMVNYKKYCRHRSFPQLGQKFNVSKLKSLALKFLTLRKDRHVLRLGNEGEC